jgi:HAD superfamily hydrolase (TIGR01549 family)
VIVDSRKWPDRPSRQATAVVLGDDVHGTWLGHASDGPSGDATYVFLIPTSGWWIGRHFPDGGWKLDVTTPAVWGDGVVQVIDLDLDVRRLHGRTWIEDEDEFEERRGDYPADVATAAQETAQLLHRRLDDYEEAFGPEADEWLAVLHQRRTERAHKAAVFFDMGGVLTVDAGDANRHSWCRRLGVDADTLQRLYIESIGPGWEGGRRPNEIVARLAERLEVSSEEADRLVGDLHCDQVLDPDLAAIAESLPPGVIAGIISNNGADVRRHWRRAHDLERRFRTIVISGEERIAKPDPRIYRIAAARAGVPPQACLFVDDSPANVEAAESTGMQGILHRADRQTAGLVTRWLETVAVHG